jgi:1,4-dihydroxy-6-naphthoate synthase
MTLRVAYTPDSDDAYNFYAWEFDRVRLPDPRYRVMFERDHIIALNRAAMQETFDVVSVSSVAYPALAGAYRILASGNSIGRGYGPVMVSRHHRTLAELRGKRVAVAGRLTTGGALAMMYCEGAQFVEMTYDRIADAIVRGECDAGVMIHEELLYFPEKGLHAIADLGRVWCQETGLPLPVGLNLVRRALGSEMARQIAATCQRSLRWAQEHDAEAFAYASGFGRGCARKHIELFSNADTLCAPEDARAAMRLMFQRVADLGLASGPCECEVVDA